MTTSATMMDEADVIINSESLYLFESVLFLFDSELIESQEKSKPSPKLD